MLAGSLAGPLVRPGGAFDDALSLTCHRQPGRCLPLPQGRTALCARCTAFWGGVAAGALLLRRRHRSVPFWVGFPMVLSMIADGTIQRLCDYESTNAMRTATGLAAGLGVTFILLGAGLAGRSG